jgi:hypothetical protein
MEGHAKPTRDRVGLIDPAATPPADVEFLQSHDVRTRPGDHVSDAGDVEAPIDAQAPVHVIGEYADDQRPSKRGVGSGTPSPPLGIIRSPVRPGAGPIGGGVRRDVGSVGCCGRRISRLIGGFAHLVRKTRSAPVYRGAHVLQIRDCGVGRLIECGPGVVSRSGEVVARPVKISGGAMRGPALVVAAGKEANEEPQ